jgi:hypothetical protein
LEVAELAAKEARCDAMATREELRIVHAGLAESGGLAVLEAAAEVQPEAAAFVAELAEVEEEEEEEEEEEDGEDSVWEEVTGEMTVEEEEEEASVDHGAAFHVAAAPDAHVAAAAAAFTTTAAAAPAAAAAAESRAVAAESRCADLEAELRQLGEEMFAAGRTHSGQDVATAAAHADATATFESAPAVGLSRCCPPRHRHAF